MVYNWIRAKTTQVIWTNWWELIQSCFPLKISSSYEFNNNFVDVAENYYIYYYKLLFATKNVIMGSIRSSKITHSLDVFGMNNRVVKETMNIILDPITTLILKYSRVVLIVKKRLTPHKLRTTVRSELEIL